MMQTLGKVLVKREKWVRYLQTEGPQIAKREGRKIVSFMSCQGCQD